MQDNGLGQHEADLEEQSRSRNGKTQLSYVGLGRIADRCETVCDHDYFQPDIHYCVVAAGRPNQVPLKGDSGGPLVCEMNGTEALYETHIGSIGRASYYTRLEAYKEWIREIMKEVTNRREEIVEAAQRKEKNRKKNYRRYLIRERRREELRERKLQREMIEKQNKDLERMERKKKDLKEKLRKRENKKRNKYIRSEEV